MASNTPKSPKRNPVAMMGSAAANTFTNAAAVALFANPALAINPANIPAPESRTTPLKLVAKNPISYVPKPQPHTPQRNASEYQILVKKGDHIGKLTFLSSHTILGIDNNGNVFYSAITDKGFAYFRNREVVWSPYQEIDGFKTGSGDFSRASITPEGDTYISLGGIRDAGKPQQRVGYIVLRNGEVAFDSTLETSDVVDISANPNALGLMYIRKTNQIVFRYLTQPQGGGAWQSHEKILGTSPLFNKYKNNEIHFHVPPDHSGFHAYDPIESQNGKHAVFYGYDAAGTFVATMGGRAVNHPIAQIECCPTQDKANGKAASAEQCPDTTIKPTDDAKAIVRKFREKFTVNASNSNCISKSPWKGINDTEHAKAIADRLDELIDNKLKPVYDPNTHKLIYYKVGPNQGQLSLCGPAAFFYLWFKNDPRSATFYATELYEKGKSQIGNIDVDPGKLVESGNYDERKDGMPAADWMMLGALRNSENRIPFLGRPDDLASAITFPWEIRKWLSATKLYSSVDSYRIPKKVSQYPNPSRKNEEIEWNKLIDDFSTIEDKDVILLVNSEMVSGTHYLIPIPNHYIVLTSQIKETKEGKVEFSYWSWGQQHLIESFPKSVLENMIVEAQKKS